LGFFLGPGIFDRGIGSYFSTIDKEGIAFDEVEFDTDSSTLF